MSRLFDQNLSLIMSDQPSTSRGIPEKGVDLEKAQDAFEGENRTEQK